MSTHAEDLANKIREIAGDAPVKVGLILGSGLGHLAGAVEGIAIPYDETRGVPPCRCQRPRSATGDRPV